MNDIFNALKKLDKYDSLSNRSITRPNPTGARASKFRPRIKPNPQPLPKPGIPGTIYDGGGWWDGGTAAAGSLSGAWGGFTPMSQNEWLKSQFTGQGYHSTLNPEGIIPSWGPQSNDWAAEGYADYWHWMQQKHGQEFEGGGLADSLEPYNYGSAGQYGIPDKVKSLPTTKSGYGRGGPGSGGSRDMGVPSLGNVLTGRPNRKRY